MAGDTLRTPTWLLDGITGSVPGVLELSDGRLTFTTDDGLRVFDAPLSEVSNVRFPWYYFSGGVKLNIGVNRYRLSFVQPENVAGHSDVAGGRQTGKVWKTVLNSRMST